MRSWNSSFNKFVIRFSDFRFFIVRLVPLRLLVSIHRQNFPPPFFNSFLFYNLRSYKFMTALQSINRKNISPPYFQMECLIYSFVLYIQYMQKTAFTYIPRCTSKRTNRFYIAGVFFHKTPIRPIRCHVDYQCSHALPNIHRKFFSYIWATYLDFIWPNVSLMKYLLLKYFTKHKIAKHTMKTLFSYTSSLSMIAEKQQVLHHPVDFQSTHQTLHLNLPFSL